MSDHIFEDDEPSPSHDTAIDIRNETDHLVSEVVETVAAAEGTDPTALPPLYDTVDPESFSRSLNSDVSVEFTYCGYRVVVRGEGGVEIADEEPLPDEVSDD